jgi:hypothetical protein
VFSMRILSFILLLSVSLRASGQGEAPATRLDEFDNAIGPFLAAYCVGCHGEKKHKADFFLHDIDPLITNGQDVERWEKALEMLSNGDMPPEEAKSVPSRAARLSVEQWIAAELKKIDRGPDEARLSRPEFGNRIDHRELFSGEHQGPAASPPRLWRKNLQIHHRFETDNRLPQGNIPFNAKGGHGFQDYATLLANESTIKTLRINAKNYLAELIDGRLVESKGPDGKPDKTRLVREGRSRWREFNDVAHAEQPPTAEAFDKAVARGFELLLYRQPNAAELERYSRQFLMRSVEIAGPRDGLESLLTALILAPEFIYRQEIGLGEALPDGRRMLAPREIAYAIAYALTDAPPDAELARAVEEDRLTSQKDAEREVRRMLATSTRPYWDYEINHTFEQHVEACPNPRILRFFREFFGYDGVFDVFKDKSRNEDHKPEFLFKDADLFVLSVLEKDRQVFRQLLTSDRYVVHYVSPRQAEQKLKQLRNGDGDGRIKELLAQGITPVLGGYRGGRYYTAYGFDPERWNYPIEQPFEVAHRAGMLTHPAWLVAHSGNFDTDPIRRGKWIREHLLADTIPEIPIGVDARLEEDPHQTLRERLAKTTGSACWRCHKKMNPLGLPFEIYDDFGRYRERIVLGDADAYFQAKRHYDGQRRNWEKEREDWLSYDAEGRAKKIAQAEETLASLKQPQADAENVTGALRNYENDVKRWTGEREKWSKIDDAEQQRRIKDLDRRLSELVAPVPEADPVDASGELSGTDDPKLDGEVKDALELVRRLAESELARQSFVRHAFRYWMGRNETLDDSPTLKAADKAYVESDGSFKELLVSLLTSDSFLLRKDEN